MAHAQSIYVKSKENVIGGWAITRGEYSDESFRTTIVVLFAVVRLWQWMEKIVVMNGHRGWKEWFTNWLGECCGNECLGHKRSEWMT